MLTSNYIFWQWYLAKEFFDWSTRGGNWRAAV